MSKNDLLSYGSIVQDDPMIKDGGRHIVCLSGGVASAHASNKIIKKYGSDVLLYFNDTKWEHKDLYRFLDDLENYFDKEIIRDSDGRNPEQIFYDKKMLGSNMAPICSKVLKAERLQSFVRPEDTVYFGIDITEIHRAARITPIYDRLQVKSEFPLLDPIIKKEQMFDWVKSTGIEIPQMYKDGFPHNNCSGGCVRGGAKHWISVLKTYPDVFEDRERIEKEFTSWNQKRRLKNDPDYESREYTFLKRISLSELRRVHEKGLDFDFGEDEWQGECVGICGRMY